MIEQGLTTFARGGGCFLAGTMISTPDGERAIETLRKGSTVYSFNETTKQKEESKVGKLDSLVRDHYYVINGIISATGEHPFYTTQGIVEVQDLNVGMRLVGEWDKEIPIRSIQRVDVDEVKVYNLLDVTPNNNYYATRFLVHNKGGSSCFLADTPIDTEHGTVYIQDIKSGDKVLSYNEEIDEVEVSTVERLDVLASREFYYINYNVKVTGEHPFYVYDENTDKTTVKKVKELKLGDTLVTRNGFDTITHLQKYVDDVVVYNLINVDPNHNYFAAGYLVHNKGGFSGGARSSSGSRSSSTSTSKSTSGTSSRSTTTTRSTAPKVGTSTAKPGSAIKTADGKTVVSSTKKPTTARTPVKSKGIVGDNGYTPRFSNGYNAPAGSVVYYPQHSALDYLPWIYLFSQDHSPAPDRQTATVVQPDGKEIQAKPVAQGTDGLAIFNWFLLILIIIALIGGAVWGVNKLVTRKNNTNKPKTEDRWY